MDGASDTEVWLAEFEAMRAERQCVDPFYQAGTYYFDPLNAQFWCRDASFYQAPKFNGDILTGVGISSLNRLAQFLMGNGTPPTAKWLELNDENEDIRAQEDVADFWAGATKTVANDLRGKAGMQSSFYIAMRDAYKGMGVSYGVVHVSEYKPRGLPTGDVVYESCPAHACWYRLGAHGELVSFAYLREMTDDQAQGFMQRNVSKAVGRLDKAHKSSSRRQILQMVKLVRDAPSNPRDASEFMFQERWIDITERETLVKTGHRSQPFHVLGWNKIPGSHYYVGPSYDALPDVTGAAAARKAQLQAMAWQGRPPMLAGSKDGFDNPSKTLVPGRITFNAINNKGQQLIQPLQGVSNSGVFQYAVADDEARVRDLMMGNELLSQRRPNMTATEVMQVAQERAQMVAPFMTTTIPSISGMMMRHFEIKLRTGGLSEVPAAVAQEGGFSAEFSGPMAIAARQSEVGNVFQTLEQMQVLANFNPAAARMIDVQEVSTLLAAANGTLSVLRDWDEVQGEMKQEAQMQAEAAEAQIAQMEAGAMKDQAQAVGAVMQ